MLCTQVIYVFTAAIFNQGLILTHGWIVYLVQMLQCQEIRQLRQD
jgi:hypothetical protein